MLQQTHQNAVILEATFHEKTTSLITYRYKAWNLKIMARRGNKNSGEILTFRVEILRTGTKIDIDIPNAPLKFFRKFPDCPGRGGGLEAT